MVSHEEKRYLYWLCHVPSIGAVTIKRLYEYIGSYQGVYKIEGKELQRLGLLKKSSVDALEASKKHKEIWDREFDGLSRSSIQFVTPHDDLYPARLHKIYDYPMGLFYRGRLPEEKRPTVAIIGARNCTNYGKQMASYLAKELVACGAQIISGLATGIDGAGHRGALEGNGETYGVLGCGINICYPKENYELFEQMKEKGGIITEFAPNEAPRPCNFPMRNRIISGLSDAILVIEAREKSGSLITAHLGLDQGKEIFALPGRVTDPFSAGCNRLISEGAGIILNTDSILEYFNLQTGKMLRVHKKNHNGLAKKEKIVYSCLDLQPKNLEEIVCLSGLSVSECMGILLDLELNGLIVQTSHQYYGKKL